MLNSTTLHLAGDLYMGGTTEAAQIAFIRLNGDAIKSIGQQLPLDNPSTLRDDVLAILERDLGMDPKRGTKRAIRELICAGQSDEKVQRERRSSVTTRGRKVTVRSQPPPSDSSSLSAPSPVIQNSDATAVIPADKPLATLEWPVIRTWIKDLNVDSALRALLLAVVRKDPIEEIVRLRTALTGDWHSQGLPADVLAALRWVDAQA